MGTFVRRAAVLSLALLLGLAGSRAYAQGTGADRTGSTVELSEREAGLKGVVGHWWYLEANLGRFLDAYADLGVTTVRITTDWRQLEPEEGRLDFARTDRLFAALLDRGIEPVPVFATVPVWAALNPDACRAVELACSPNPAKLGALESTAAALVGRYPRVTRWEFWNEPEMWEGFRDAAAHNPWHRAFYRGAKRGLPSARVALGTLTGWEFVARSEPDLPFDAVTMHSFEDHRADPIHTARIEQLRAELLARGRDVPIWLTEYGWDSRWLDDAGRADTIRWVFDWLRAHPYVELAHYHMLHDTDDPTTCCYGLLGPPPQFAPKGPAYDAFRAYAVKR